MLDKIMERLPLTVGMNVISLILTLIIAIPIGILSACRQNSLLDRGVTVFVYLGFAMPSFWLALLLMLFFGIHLQWLHISGRLEYDQADPAGAARQLTALGRSRRGAPAGPWAQRSAVMCVSCKPASLSSNA